MSLNENYADYIVPLSTSPREFLRDYGEYGATLLSNDYGLLQFPLNEPNLLSDYSEYGFVPRLFVPLDTVSLTQSGITQVQNLANLSLSGRGILIGFLDSGIDYTHPAFRDQQRTRFAYIWDQSAQGEPPENFPFGIEYNRVQIDQALSSDDPLSLIPLQDPTGHGTHMAGIACGSPDDEQEFIGAAYESTLLFVKLRGPKPYLREFYFADQTKVQFAEQDIMLGIRYLVQRSEQLDMPLVICIGFGTNQGDHKGNGPLETQLSKIPFSPPSVIVAAAGNEAGRAHHFSDVISDSTSLETEAEIEVPVDTEGFTMEFWGLGTVFYEVGFRTPLGRVIPPFSARLNQFQTVTFSLERTKIEVRYELFRLQSGAQLIFVRLQSPTPGIWTVTIRAQAGSPLPFHIWLPAEGTLRPDIRFLRPDPDTTITNPANTKDCITTAAYNAYDGSLYQHSSRGYTADSAIKPDITSPGVSVYGPLPGGQYGRRTGSSCAAAITAGAVAILSQWAMDRIPPVIVRSVEMKSLLIRGAKRDTATSYPNQKWGFGTLDIYLILASL